jgi:hypothetical protein
VLDIFQKSQKPISAKGTFVHFYFWEWGGEPQSLSAVVNGTPIALPGTVQVILLRNCELGDSAAVGVWCLSDPIALEVHDAPA